MTEFSAYLYKRMVERNLKSNQLAKLSGVSSSEVSRLLSGERRRPNPDILRKLAPILRVPYAELIEIAYPAKTAKEKEKVKLTDENKIKQLARDVAEYSIKEFAEKYIPKSLKFIPIAGYANIDAAGRKGRKKVHEEVVPSLMDADIAVIAGSDDLATAGINIDDLIFIKKTAAVRENEMVLAGCQGKLYIGMLAKDKKKLLDGSGSVICEDIDEIIGVKAGLFRKG